MLGTAAMKALIEARVRPALRSVSRLPAGAGAEVSGTPALAWRTILKQAVLLWIATRAVYALITFYAITFTDGVSNPNASYSPSRLIGIWQQLDVTWYLSVAAGGYAPDVTRTAFFPFYPILVAIVTFLIGGAAHRLAAAMIVSNLSALAAFFGIGLLAAHEDNGDTGAARPAILMLAAYPLAFFMVAGYAEATLVALCVFALYFARRGQWRWAALCGFLAGLTRPTAIILILPLLWEFGRQRGIWQSIRQTLEARKAKRWAALPKQLAPRMLGVLGEWALVVVAVPAGIGLYALYLWRQFGHPFTFVTLQTTVWQRQLVPPWQWIRLAVHAWRHMVPWSFAQARTLVDLAPLLVCIALTAVLIYQRWPVAYILYMLGVLYTAVSNPMVQNTYPLAAAGRYLLPAIPAFLLLARWTRTRPALRTALVGGGFAVQAILVTYFLHGGWLI
ncbi:MAG TPA: hypothetical protein VKT52_06565 [Ktedonobacterales bacterium]|nr:hypothetical protein [Ktedonobacterales bacterium]